VSRQIQGGRDPRRYDTPSVSTEIAAVIVGNGVRAVDDCEGRLCSGDTTLTRSQDTSDLESGLVRPRNAQVPTTILPGFYAVGI
jgi:hypothetical protein